MGIGGAGRESLSKVREGCSAGTWEKIIPGRENNFLLFLFIKEGNKSKSKDLEAEGRCSACGAVRGLCDWSRVRGEEWERRAQRWLDHPGFCRDLWL